MTSMIEEQNTFPPSWKYSIRGDYFTHYANIVKAAGPAASLKPLQTELKKSEALEVILDNEYAELWAKATMWQRKTS